MIRVELRKCIELTAVIAKIGVDTADILTLCGSWADFDDLKILGHIGQLQNQIYNIVR